MSPTLWASARTSVQISSVRPAIRKVRGSARFSFTKCEYTEYLGNLRSGCRISDVGYQPQIELSVRQRGCHRGRCPPSLS